MPRDLFAVSSGPRDLFDDLQSQRLDQSLGRQLGLTGRYAIEGITALPAMVGDAANSAVNAAFGTKLGPVSQGISSLLDKVGLPKPETPTERVVGDMSRAVAGAGGSVAGAIKAGIAPLAERPLMQLASAASGAGAAGTTRESGGGPIAQLGAALAGGVAPYAAESIGKNLVGGVSGIAKGISAKTPEQLDTISTQKFSDAGNLYNRMRSNGAVFNSNKTNDILSSVDQAVAKHQFIPELNPKTLAIVNHLKRAANNGELGLDQLDQYRRLLQRVGMTEDGVSAGAVRSAIDSAVNSATPSDLSKGTDAAISLLREGRNAYSQASRFDDVANIISKANGDPNRIKAAFQRFVSNDKNLRGFSAQEVDALRNAANTGVAENVFKAFGKFGFDFSKSGTGNTVLPALATGGGFAGILPHGVPLAAAGTLMRQGQKYLARGKAQNVLDTIEGIAKVVPPQQKQQLLNYMAQSIYPGSIGYGAAQFNQGGAQ